MALRPDVQLKIVKIVAEYKEIEIKLEEFAKLADENGLLPGENVDDDFNHEVEDAEVDILWDKREKLGIILQCDKALKDIEKDLALFDEHLKGENESLKDSARRFMVEFSSCKDQIEKQLNELLSDHFDDSDKAKT